MPNQRAQQSPLLLAHPARRVLGRCLKIVGLCPAQVLHEHPQHVKANVASSVGALLQPVEHLDHDQRRHAGQAHLAGHRDRRCDQSPSVLIQARHGVTFPQPSMLMRLAVGDQAAMPISGTGRHPADTRSVKSAARRVGGELGHRHPAAQLAPPVRPAQAMSPRTALASRHHTPRHAGRYPPGRFAPAHQKMISGWGQDPTRAIPSTLSQKPWVDKPSQPCHPPVDGTVDTEHVRYHTAGRSHRPSDCHGHRVTPACSRGLGTASTAARSRDGSGCTYTCDEDTDACPSRSATTSIPDPASARLLPQACRS
jgi:hypothetical protein